MSPMTLSAGMYERSAMSVMLPLILVVVIVIVVGTDIEETVTFEMNYLVYLKIVNKSFFILYKI